MNYPPIPPATQSYSPTRPRRRPTYGDYSDEQYGNNLDNIAPPLPPRRRPVGLPTRVPTYGADSRRQNSYSVNDPSGRVDGYWQPTYDSPQSPASYPEPQGTLVYPANIVYEQPPPPPPKQYSHEDEDDPQPGTDLLGTDNPPQGFNDIYRPLPARPERSSYPPELNVPPYSQPSAISYPDEQRFLSPTAEYSNIQLQGPYSEHSRRSPSIIQSTDFLEMPTPLVEDSLHPLPPTPKSPSPHSYMSPSPEPQNTTLHRQGSGQRPGTRSSTSSMYTPERPIEDDFCDYNGDSYSASAVSPRANSFGRSDTRKFNHTSLHIQTDDLGVPVPPPPPPPPHIVSPTQPPRSHTPSSSYSSPPIYRSRTEPGHTRTTSAEPFAPPPPPKIPLTEGLPRPSSLGVLRSQSHSTKPVPRFTSHPIRLAQELAEESTPLTPVVDCKSFPLSSKTFEKCTEPWSLSSLRLWIQDIFGANVSMETISSALQGLFTHYVSTLSIQNADKLAAQVGTSWVREGVLFEPTVANTALWNPLSTLEMSFTRVTVEGVLPTLTGNGCYAPKCSSAPPGVGRCYSHLCSRTLMVKPGLLSPPPLPTPTATKASDWTSFWPQIDAEFLRTIGKKEEKRQQVIFEFIQSEEEYVQDLTLMLSLFRKQLIESVDTTTPIISPTRIDGFVKTVFGCVAPILEWQTKALLIPLRERQVDQGPLIRGVGDIVQKWVRGCREIYADYAGNYILADLLVREEQSSNPIFAQWLERLQSDPACRRLSFNSFMQTPNRKIQRVLLLFAEIIKYTEETNRDRETLQNASAELKESVHECDARTAESTSNLEKAELDEKLVFKANQKVDLGLREPARRIIHRGDVSRKSDNKLEWLDVHLILLDNFLVMTKKKRERGVERYYVSKQAIPVDLLQLEGVTGDAVAKTAKYVGTMTTTVVVSPTQPTNRNSTTPDASLITSPTADKLIYPFSITYLSSSGDTYTLFADSAAARHTWVDKIMEARNERAFSMSKIEPFQARIVAESVFGTPATIEQMNQKIPALVELSTMHRSLVALRAEPFGSRTLGRAITSARVNCAKAFIAPENTDYAHQRLVAVGTDDGVYIGHLPELSGLCTRWNKVLSLNSTTQIDVLEEFGVFLVLANKELIAYSLSSVIPALPTAKAVDNIPPVGRQPQRLSGSHSVGFFATGKLKDRMLVIYKKKSGVTSVFKALEPVVGKADANRRNLFNRKKVQTEFFREYDDFFIAADCFGLFTFKNTIAIPTQKGFEVLLSLDSKDAPQTIPDLSAPHMAHLARRLEGMKALGMYRISDKEFLLCYDECAIYVDKHGDISSSKIINWHGKPRATQVIEGKYVLAFDTSFIEIWRCDRKFDEGGVSLVQIIPGRDVRMIGKEEEKAELGLGPSTGYYDRVYVAMGHPERADRQVVVELCHSTVLRIDG